MAKSTKKHYESALNKGPNQAFPFSDKYFQSADFNHRTFAMYRQWLTSIALNRFKWVNLPPTVSARYLEMNLYYQGVATIARYPETDIVYGLQAVVNDYPNEQDNYDHWRCMGQTGALNFDSDINSGILIWDNRQRMQVAQIVDLYARRLTTIDRTLDINMLQQRTPFVITGPQDKMLDVANVMKSIAGGEPAIVGFSGLTDQIKIEAVQTGVPCIATDVNTAWTMVWNNALRFLGLGGVNEKAERLVTMEAETQQEPAELMALDPLTARREACEAYNALFALSFVKQYGPLEVYWAKDNQSDTFNYLNNPIMREDSNEAL